MTIGVGSRVKAAVDLFTDVYGDFQVPSGTEGIVVSPGIVWDWLVQFDTDYDPDPVNTHEIEEVEA